MRNNLKFKIANWMRGRYGVDALYKFTIALTFVFLVMNLIFPSPLFYGLSIGFAVYSFVRAFSRNLSRRTAENQKYLALKNKASQKVLLIRNRFRDRGTHRYRACPKCRQMLRLTKKVGVNHVICPKCKNEFDINIRF